MNYQDCKPFRRAFRRAFKLRPTDAEVEALVRATKIVLRNTEEIYTTLPISMRGALTGLVIALRPFQEDK